MKPSEAIPLVGDAQAALLRIRDGMYRESLAPDEKTARAARTDTALEVFALQRTVDRLARLAGGPKRATRVRAPEDEPRDVPLACDRCGGPADRYGDCVAGGHLSALR